MGKKFFVAKINLPQASSGKVDLNPLQIQFDSPEFMLPIRLGMANAKPGQEQDLIAYFLTDEGQVDLMTYPLTKIPSNVDIPVETESMFDIFYQRTFAKANADRPYPTAFLEYAWDMSWCDPCAADPLSNNQLRDLGAFWIKKARITDHAGRRGSDFKVRAAGPAAYSPDLDPKSRRLQASDGTQCFFDPRAHALFRSQPSE